MSVFNILDFGADPTGNPASAQANLTAFHQILAEMDAAAGSDNIRGGKIIVPTGNYVMAGVLRITRCVILEGEGVNNSKLTFTGPDISQVKGIVIDLDLKLNPDNTIGIVRDAQGTVVRDLTVQTLGFAFFPGRETEPPHLPPVTFADDDPRLEVSASGISIHATFVTVENCSVQGFVEDGIHIVSDPNKPRLPDSWQVTNCLIQQNGRHGLFVFGGDANVGLAKGSTFSDNCRWGVYDHSDLGNAYLMCQCESNGVLGASPPGGPFQTVSCDARSTFFGCYTEGDQDPSILVGPSAVYGGLHGARFFQANSSTTFAAYTSEGGVQLQGPVVLGCYPLPLGTNASPVELDTVSLGSVYLCDASNLPPGLTVCLPAIGNHDLFGHGFQGFTVTFKRVNKIGGNVIIKGAGQLIDGQASQTLTSQFAWITLIGYGSSWNIIGRG